MVQNDVPKRLWDYSMRWVSEVMQRMASNAGSLDWCTPVEKIALEMPEISEYLDFGFYDWCWYMDQASLDAPKFRLVVGSLTQDRDRYVLLDPD